MLRRMLGAGGSVWLVGMMGAGKSALAVRLARRLGVEALDTDAEVEASAGMRIAEIFAEHGEAEFRRLERDAIISVAGRRAVIALGGGALTQPGLAERIGESGTLVYLRAQPGTLAQRVGNGAGRPLLAAAGRSCQDGDALRARLAQLLAEREPMYLRSDLIVDTDGRSTESLVEELVQKLEAIQ